MTFQGKAKTLLWPVDILNVRSCGSGIAGAEVLTMINTRSEPLK